MAGAVVAVAAVAVAIEEEPPLLPRRSVSGLVVITRVRRQETSPAASREGGSVAVDTQMGLAGRSFLLPASL